MSGPHVADRVRETSTTTGTGTLTLLGATTGYRTFTSAIGNGNTAYYLIAHENGTEWEIGIGTVAAGTLARTSVEKSSNLNNLVNFSAGTKNVICTLPASKIENATGSVTQVNTGTGLTGGPITTTGTLALADTAVTPGSYTNADITVDAQGRITAAANGAGGGSGQRSSISVLFDGGGSPIPADQAIILLIPFDCTIVSALMFADTSGDITVDITKDIYGTTYPPATAVSSGFAISSNSYMGDGSLSGWSTSLTDEDVIMFKTNGVATNITRCTVQLIVERV